MAAAVEVVDLLGHPLSVVLIATAIGALGWFARAQITERRAERRQLEDVHEVVSEIKKWVVDPYFAPPQPGQPDMRLPTKVDRIAEEQQQVARDLRTHMDDEERWMHLPWWKRWLATHVQVKQ